MTNKPYITKLFGVAGAGKTRALIQMLLNVVNDGVVTRQIAFCSHTNFAVDEVIDRLKRRYKIDSAEYPLFGTVHAIARRQIDWPTNQLITPQPGNRWMGILESQTGLDFRRDRQRKSFLPDVSDCLRLYSYANNYDVTIESALSRYEGLASPDLLHEALEEYQAFKRAEGLFDYDDILMEYLNERNDPLLAEWMFIDEAQDLSNLQWRVVRKMYTICRQVVLAGDDDQQIFNFHETSIDFADIPADETRKIEKSYRCGWRIGSLAERVVAKIEGRENKDFEWGDHEGEVRVINRSALVEEVKRSAGQEVQILALEHSTLDEVCEDLMRAGIVFKRRDGSPHPDWRYSPAGAAEIASAYYRAGEGIPTVLGRSLAQSFSAIGYRIAEKIAAATAEAEKVSAPVLTLDLTEAQDLDLRTLGPLDILVNLRRAIRHAMRLKPDILNEPCDVEVKTFHASKGTECDKAFVLMQSGDFFQSRLDADQDMERRLCYVAMTRARTSLILVRKAEGKQIPTLQAVLRELPTLS